MCVYIYICTGDMFICLKMQGSGTKMKKQAPYPFPDMCLVSLIQTDPKRLIGCFSYFHGASFCTDVYSVYYIILISKL